MTNAIITTIQVNENPARCYACLGEIAAGATYVRVETRHGRYARLYCSVDCVGGQVVQRG